MASGSRILRSILMIGIADLLVVGLWMFFHSSHVTHMVSKPNYILQALHLQDPFVCRGKQHLAFIKVQKAGSSTVQNIFYRFGTYRNLTFVLPKYGNYISYSTFVKERDVMPLPIFADKFDITCNHVKYNRTAFEKFLPSDTSYVAIIRHPLALLNSYIYYFLEHVVPGQDKLTVFLQSPETYASQRNVSFNLMTNYLGLPSEFSKNMSEINSFIERIDKEFDAMLVLELLDESLLLMKRQFCWNISDVLYVKKNVNFNNPSFKNLTALLRDKHRHIASADYIFYRHFHKKTIDRVFHEGVDFQRELAFYRQTKESVSKYCSRQLWSTDGPLKIRESPWQAAFQVSGEMCQMIMMSELELQDLVGVRQYGNAWKKLHRPHFYH